MCVNAYVGARVVNASISGARDDVAEILKVALLKCDRYFVDDADFLAWLQEVGLDKSASLVRQGSLRPGRFTLE